MNKLVARLILPGTVVLPVLVGGCNRESLPPVAGQLFINGKPLTLQEQDHGRVWFQPDPTKGNTCNGQPSGKIDTEGRYNLFTSGRPGAPVGWYKVMVLATDRIDPYHPKRPRKSFISGRYGKLETTDLPHHKPGEQWISRENVITSAFANWDGVHYRQIATEGYSYDPAWTENGARESEPRNRKLFPESGLDW